MISNNSHSIDTSLPVSRYAKETDHTPKVEILGSSLGVENIKKAFLGKQDSSSSGGNGGVQAGAQQGTSAAGGTSATTTRGSFSSEGSASGRQSFYDRIAAYTSSATTSRDPSPKFASSSQHSSKLFYCTIYYLM